jgi:retinol-binding protein 3
MASSRHAKTRNVGVYTGAIVGLLILAIAASVAPALGDSPAKDRALDNARRDAIIEQIVLTFDEHYIDADIAESMGVELRRRHARGDYDDVATLNELTSRLTDELQEICDDLHVLILPYKELPAYRFEDKLIGEPEDNFGFRRVERLPANIGYLRFDRFYNTREAGATAVAAMNFLAHCDALIIDLRYNGGGDTTMSQLLTSYFFDEAKLLNTYYTRHGDKTEESWTMNYVPGPSMAETPVYLLISPHSFSAAESFAYQLKHMGRATLIGEATGGGGNAVTYKSYPEAWINIRVPNSRDINPVTGTSFQGIGVFPHIEVPYGDAYAVANREAVRSLLDTQTDEQKRRELQWAVDEYQAALKPVELGDEERTEYLGRYGERSIVEVCDRLHYRRQGSPPRALVAMGEDRFTFESERMYSSYRMVFVRDGNGRVSGFYFDGPDGDPSGVYERSD